MLLKNKRIFNKKYSFFNRYAIYEVNKFATFVLFLILSIDIMCLYSAAGGQFNPYASRQLLYIAISLIAFYIIISLNYKFWINWSYRILFASILSLIAIIPFGKRALGASRWIDFGFITIQPSEFAKIAIVLALAKFFSKIKANDIRKLKTIIKSFLIIALPVLLIIIQPDLATTIVVFGVFVVMLFVIGIPLMYFYLSFLSLLLASPFVWFKFLKDYQKLISTIY